MVPSIPEIHTISFSGFSGILAKENTNTTTIGYTEEKGIRPRSIPKDIGMQIIL